MAIYTLIKLVGDKQYLRLVETDPKVIVDYINEDIADGLYIGNYRVFIEHDQVGNTFPSEYLLITTFMAKYGGVN